MLDYLNDPTDPFAQLLQPPPDETPAQKTARLKRESDAQRVSDAIDEDIRIQRNLAKKESNVVKVLLLGQAESGKSTTLKNFRMRYAAADWERERNSWRAIVQLNIIRSILIILSVVEAELNLYGVGEEGVSNGGTDGNEPEVADSPYHFTSSHQLLLIRLAPLRSLEADLRRWIGVASSSPPSSTPVSPSLPPSPALQDLPMSATPFDVPAVVPSPSRSGYNTNGLGHEDKEEEIAVRCWDVLNRALSEPTHSGSSVPGFGDQMNSDLFDSCTTTLARCKNDMKALWEDEQVKKVMEKRRVRLPDSAGFFLDSLNRIATRDYVVSDDDIVRARLKTVGIQEYRVRFENAPLDAPRVDGAWEWRIFDVGGCRTVRHAWLPFFENTNCIIFLVPLSSFDERLAEDPRVNRLEDSTLLWKSICEAKLLRKTQLVLFMNKCDLLKRKLRRGVKFGDYLVSYNHYKGKDGGERKNDVPGVFRYLREKFKDILKQYSPEPRASYIYPTTVTDTTATARTLESVADGVFRENLVQSQLL